VSQFAKSSSKEPTSGQIAEILADFAASPCLWDVVSDEREYNSRFSAGKFAGFEAVVLPKLPELKPQAVLLPIFLLHSFRHLGLMFLTPGATYAGIPSQFAYPAAFGDLLAALLAVAAILAVVRNARGGRLLVWIFNVEGTVDLIAAIVLATVYGASVYMGPAYWIPAFWVPALLVTHYITFVVLWKHWKNTTQ
jgi:hypothetical protein